MKKLVLIAAVAGMTIFSADAQTNPGNSSNGAAREHRKDGDHKHHGKKKGHGKKHKKAHKAEAAPVKQEGSREGKGSETPKKD